MTNETTKNTITLINLKDPNNSVFVEKLRAKLGNAIDNITIFAYQNGVQPLAHKFHAKQNKLFVSYPRFNMMTTSSGVFLYLKRIGENFPSVCYRIKKSDVKTKLSNDEINNYINETVDTEKFLEDIITNETKVVMDNLKISVLIKAIEKIKKADETDNGPITYARLFDMIRTKLDEVVDSGYLDLLNRTCVMIWETWSNPANVNFKYKTITPEPKKKQKVFTKNTSSDSIIKDIVKEPKVMIPEFTKPVETPKLENVIDELKEGVITKTN